MTGYHYYGLVAGCFACYTLGLKHARGHKGWKNTGVALLAGAGWPIMAVWGAWLTHGKRGG